jgi:maleate isomerase
MLTPSSNTVLEPTTVAMLAGLPAVTAHFARFKVTEIALSERALGQFDDSEILRAAELLADAKVHAIAWNGTSAGWLGFERDERLCERITGATGIAACTSILAYREIFQRTGVRRVGLVTPYRDDVQGKITANWAAAGLPCTAERHLRLQDNFSFSEVSEATVAEMTCEVAREGCDAVAVVCTNMRGPRSRDRSSGRRVCRSTIRSLPRCGKASLSPASTRRGSTAGDRSSGCRPMLRPARRRSMRSRSSPRSLLSPRLNLRHGVCHGR